MKRIAIALAFLLMPTIALAGWTNTTEYGGTTYRWLKFLTDLDMEGHNILNITSLCIGSDCKTSWPAGGDITNNYNITNITYAGGNTTNEIFSVCNNGTFIDVTNETNLNVNSSSYWYNLLTPLPDWINTYNSTYDLLLTDNASWNESYSDTKYVTYTGASENLDMNGNNITNVDFLYVHNISGYSPVYIEGDLVVSGNITAKKDVLAKENLNITQWAYNMTTPAISWVQSQNYLASFIEQDPYYYLNPSGFYNASTYLINNTYNFTYDIWSYNQTIPAITFGIATFYNASNPSGYISSYTETDPWWVANYSAFNTSWSTDLWNTTSQMRTAINSSGFYNITSNTSNYISCSGIYGSPDTDFCTDATGSGSGTSFAKYNFTQADYVSNNTTYYVMNNLTLNLASSGFSVIECELPVWANATTTGVQINASFNGGSASQNHMMEYYSTAVAQAICSGITASVSCGATASGGVILTPYRIHSSSRRNGAGTFTLSLRSELAGNKDAVNVTSGSWCRAVEL